MKKRLLSLLLAIVMVIGLVPAMVIGVGADGEEAESAISLNYTEINFTRYGEIVELTATVDPTKLLDGADQTVTWSTNCPAVSIKNGQVMPSLAWGNDWHYKGTITAEVAAEGKKDNYSTSVTIPVSVHIDLSEPYLYPVIGTDIRYTITQNESDDKNKMTFWSADSSVGRICYSDLHMGEGVNPLFLMGGIENNINTVVFDDSITYVGKYTLTRCNNLEDVYFMNPDIVWESAVFGWTWGGTDLITVHAYEKAIDNNPSLSDWRGYHFTVGDITTDIVFSYVDAENFEKEYKEVLLSDEPGIDSITSALYEYTILGSKSQAQLSEDEIESGCSYYDKLIDVARALEVADACGDSAYYSILKIDDSNDQLSITGTGSVTSKPWSSYDHIDKITVLSMDDTIDAVLTDTFDDLTNVTKVNAKLGTPAGRWAMDNGLEITESEINVLCIGNSHSADYTGHMTTILNDLYNGGLNTKFNFTRLLFGCMYLFTGDYSTRARLEGFTELSDAADPNNYDGAYAPLYNQKWDIIIIQDYHESTAGVANYAQGVHETVEQIRRFQPYAQIVLYADGQNPDDLTTYSMTDYETSHTASMTSINSVSSDDVDYIIDFATPMANILTSYLAPEGDDIYMLYRNSDHLSPEIGTYYAAMNAIGNLLNYYEDNIVCEESFDFFDSLVTPVVTTPSSAWPNQTIGSMNPTAIATIKECLKNAYDYPQVITQSKYVFFNDASISLKDNTWLNFYTFLTDENVENYTYTYVIDGVETEIDTEEMLKKMSASNELGYEYRLSVALKPYQLAENVTVNMYDLEGNLVCSKTDSIRDYAGRRLEASQNENYKAALRALLEYGAAVQVYQNYKTDNLANSILH